MSLRRFLLVSSCHLSHRVCSRVAAPASLESSHFWKRTCTTIAGPALASVDASVAAPSAAAGSVKADLLATSDGSWDSAQKKERRQRRQPKGRGRRRRCSRNYLRIVERRVKKMLNALIRRREKEYGVSITQADLVRWARRLDKDGKHQHAYEWMDAKKMTFSPSELATFVGLIENLGEAFAYFKKADPDFDNMDFKSKNWPAYQVLVDLYYEKDGRYCFT